MKWPKTTKGRGWFALVCAWLFLCGVFGTGQGLSGGGWWGYLVYTGMALWVAILAFVVPRVMRWIDAGAGGSR